MSTHVTPGRGTSYRGLFLCLSWLVPATGWAHEASATAMASTLTGLLTSWRFRADVLLVVAVLAAVYIAGWWRLRQRGSRETAQAWQAGLYLTGLAVMCLALLSAIDRLASVLFTLHMVQHLLLMMVAAPLLLLANPFPAFLWGLPSRIRHGVGRLLRPGAGVRRAFWVMTWMPMAGAIFAINLWVWHHPAAYQAALRNGYIHDLEHLGFFGTALLFWWPILNPVPRVHGRIHPGFPTLHLLYLAAATGQHILLGAMLALPERVFYPFYAATPRLWGLSPLNDQALAGGIMWVAAHMYLLPVLWVVARIFAEEERAIRAREAAEVLQHSLAQHTPPQGMGRTSSGARGAGQVLGGARKT